MIIPHIEIREKVFALHEAGGLPRGDLTGWPSVDKLYTVGLSQWTLVTGTPHSGKSEWLDALMVNLAKRGDWKFFIYSPENHPVESHHAKIIEKYLGKPFNPGPNPRIEEDELDEAEEWMSGKFLFCKPERPSLEAIMREACDYPHASFKRGVVIDPWNQLEHWRPQGLSETEYVSQALSAAIATVREYNAHLWLVAHPSKLQKDRDGKYPVPGPWDVSGSAHWWNKADNAITVWRNQNEQSQEVKIYVQKVRFKHIGHIGDTTLLYDRVTGRYSEPLRAVRNYADRD